MLRRERCPNDRRGAYAVLTESGERALETAWPVYAASVRELFGDVLSDAEAACVREALERASAIADPARDA